MSSDPMPRPWLPVLLVGALGAIDLVTGLTMMTAPEFFAKAAAMPLGEPGITQGYGQRIALFGLVYLAIATQILKGNDHAKRWLVLPFLDEALNAILDVQLLATGSLPAAALLPMLGVHTFFAMGFAGVLLLERLAKKQAT